MNDKEIQELKKTISKLTNRIEKLEAIIYFSGNDIDGRLDTIIKTENVINDLYEVDVSYFSNTNPVRMRKRGHQFTAAQRAFFALLKLLREQGMPYNFLDAYYKTGSFKKILDFTEYIRVHERECNRYEAAKKMLM